MSEGAGPKRRRAPDPAERQRDAERSREALLDAALTEFAAHGYAGARTTDIATRAGVNKQLISYYFGGKEGLYQALVARWLRVEAEMTRPDMPIDDLVVAYVDVLLRQPVLARLFVWEALAYKPDGPAAEPTGVDPAQAPDVVGLADRQQAGELSADFDPAYLLLLLMAVTLAPLTLSHQVKQFTGLEPDSPEFLERFRGQLRLLVRHLSGPGSPPR
jgi:AcrR family transcriptional regulator